MKYHGCKVLSSTGGVQYQAPQAEGPYIGDDGVVYVSDGSFWWRDPARYPVPVQEPPHIPSNSITESLENLEWASTAHNTVPPNFILPTDSAERKRVPLWSGLFRYFPDALVEVARLSWAGNEKHNKGQPLHWSRDKSNDHADCLLRHQMDCGSTEVDPDTGMLHEVEVAWRSLAQLQLALERQRQGGKR